jgi:hypothetical protein
MNRLLVQQNRYDLRAGTLFIGWHHVGEPVGVRPTFEIRVFDFGTPPASSHMRSQVFFFMPLMQLARNVWRGLPWRPFASACLEHSIDSALRGVSGAFTFAEADLREQDARDDADADAANDPSSDRDEGGGETEI